MQDRQDRIAGDMKARKGKPEQNIPNGTSKTGQEDDGMQIRNARTDCQDRTDLQNVVGDTEIEILPVVPICL